MTMKPSRFNVLTSYEHTGETLFFNTLSGAFYAADTITSARIVQLLSDPREASHADHLVKFLHGKGFLVDDETDEHELVLERSRLGIGDPNRLDVIVMPNMDCNFACTYCY